MKRAIISTVIVCLLALPAIAADPLAELKKYEYGADQTSLLAVERQVEQSMADKAKQAGMAARLLVLMQDKDATLAAKQHAGIMLRICGTEAEVPGLAKMLGHDRLGEFARGALERIPAEAAGKALRASLARLKGPALVAVINSIANRHDRAAVGALIGLTADADKQIAAAAAHALGRIGGSEATACLAKLAADGKDARLAQAYLSCGIIALNSGEKSAAAGVFDRLADAKYPGPVRRGALAGQLALSADAAALIAKWLDGDDSEARLVALNDLPRQSSAWLAAYCKGKPPERAMLCAGVLASRADKAALPILVQAVRQKDNEALRVTAILAMPKIADSDAVALLIDALGDAAPVSRAATSALSDMPAGLVEDRLLAAYKKSDGQRRAALSDVLVARRMTGAVPLLLELSKVEDDGALRSDVCFSLTHLGGRDALAELVRIIQGVKNRAHRDRLETTYLEIAKRHDSTIEPILAAMKDDASAIGLMPVLGRVGGKAALAKIEAAIASDNEELKSAGIRALCNWPDTSVAERLARLVKEEKDRGVRTAALRGYIRVVSLKSDRPDDKTLQMLKWAFEAAERPEEKILVTDRASAVRDMKTLRWLVALLDDQVAAQEACRSIVDLAHHRFLRNPNRDEFAKALKRVIAISKDPQTVSRAKQYLEGV